MPDCSPPTGGDCGGPADVVASVTAGGRTAGPGGPCSLVSAYQATPATANATKAARISHSLCLR